MRIRFFTLAGLLLLLVGCAPQAGASATQAATEMATLALTEPHPVTLPDQATETPTFNGPIIPLQPTATLRAPIATLPAEATMLPLDAAPQALVDESAARLAQKLGIERAAISLFMVQAVAWPDASLGCPRSGEMYAQVITPGYQIFLKAEGSIYEFHTDQASQIVLCDVEPPHEIYQPP